MECKICDRDVYDYEICKRCGREICYRTSCNSGGSCADVDSCNSAQEYQRSKRRLKKPITQPGPRCSDCAGPLVFGEGSSRCVVCGHTAPAA